MPGCWLELRSIGRVARIAVALAALGLVTPKPPTASPRTVVTPPQPVERQDRFSLANGCWALRSKATGGLVVKSPGGYRATAGAAGAEQLRMQATRLGSYLLYGRARDFLSATADGRVAPAARPSPLADWQVSGSAGDFTISLPSRGKVLAAAGDGTLVLLDGAAAGAAARFAVEPREGCAAYPEADVNASGRPFEGTPRFGEVRGFLDAHSHLMFFEAVGGRFHCGALGTRTASSTRCPTVPRSRGQGESPRLSRTS